jgi:hypothetical protein
MKILAIEREVPDATSREYKPYLEEEAYKVWELYQSGKFREIYFRQDQSSAVIILECDNPEEAKYLLELLPLVREGLITFEVFPLSPYPGFSRLFAEK